jgi:hypothetical protein
MIGRCRYPHHPRYADYGGRGIKVCDHWQGQDGFAHFLADVGVRPEGMTLDRCNPDGDYEPGNVRWSDAKGQRWNRRDMAAGSSHNWISDRARQLAGPQPVMPF